MKILDINSLGGTCDRCGKGLVNVATIEINGKTQTVGLDCLDKVEASDFQTKTEKWEFDQSIRFAKKAARELGTIKRLAQAGKLATKFETNPNGQRIYYWKDETKHSWNWLGLAEQNTMGLYRDMWTIVTEKELLNA